MAQEPATGVALLAVTFPNIHRVAATMGAAIAVEEAAGVGSMTRSGRPWGNVGPPPAVVVSDRRGGYKVRSSSTATGEVPASVDAKTSQGEREVELLQPSLHGRPRPLRVMADPAAFHNAATVGKFVRAPRTQLRLFLFPTPSPELTPAAPVWNELKQRQLGKHPIKHQTDLKKRLRSILKSVQRKAEKVRSFFQLPDTKYAAIPEAVT